MSTENYLAERRDFLRKSIQAAGLTLVGPSILSVVAARDLEAQVSSYGPNGKRHWRRPRGPKGREERTAAG